MGDKMRVEKYDRLQRVRIKSKIFLDLSSPAWRHREQTILFTGIIEDLGTVEEIKRTDKGALVSLGTSLPLSRISIGDSVAVNGACLTVVKKRRGGPRGKTADKSGGVIAMDVSAETLRRTTLGTLAAGDRVNL